MKPDALFETMPTLMQWPLRYAKARAFVIDAYPDDIPWSEGVTFPKSATEFALEFTWVVLNSGMKFSVAKNIFPRVRQALIDHGRVGDAFGHPGKREAIDRVWKERNRLYEQLRTAVGSGTDTALMFCVGLPWIGDITKYHLAKNIGIDCAKPDRHLERVARAAGTDPHTLCAAIAKTSGDRIATVDLVIWRCCEMGVL